jgi:capsular polysaccharide biosynthesis protein
MIPRVESIREAREGAAVDHWIVPRSRLPVVDELLDRIGIDRHRVVRLSRGEQVECDLLLATSSPAPLGGPVARSIGFLQRHLSDEQLNDATPRRRLLLQRGASRRIANLDELAATIDDLRLEIVSTEGMSLATQMETFGNAELLVGVHGAGLSNAIAMFGDAALIEIVPRWYPVACYCVLAKEAGIRYFAMDADPADGRPTRNPHADLRIDPDRLREAVHAVGANAVR